MWIIRLLQAAFSIAMTVGIAGGLIDLALSMKQKSHSAAQMGLVSLTSLNRQLESGKSQRELTPRQR